MHGKRIGHLPRWHYHCIQRRRFNKNTIWSYLYINPTYVHPNFQIYSFSNTSLPFFLECTNYWILPWGLA